MKTTFLSLLSLAIFFTGTTLFGQELNVKDNFDDERNINTWFGDNCELELEADNPSQIEPNTSAKCLKYNDDGGLYANIGFNIPFHFDLDKEPKFSLYIYVASGSLTGSQNNQISLKLQNGAIGEPWTSQTEIIKGIELDKWQEVVFDFENDDFKNYDSNAADPINRKDLNRVVLQINGENNTDKVTAYIDNFEYQSTIGWNEDPNNDGFTYLIWSDEFGGEGAIDGEKWFHQTKLPDGENWFNGELQHYTDREENSFQEDGYLNLVAKKERFTDQNVTKDYTSARLNSKFAFTYGRVEIRAKLPYGAGTWPALWFLGKNITENGGYFAEEFGTTGWPACGEIDLMEHWGVNQNFIQSAMHTPSSNGNTQNKGGKYVNDVSNIFHVYGMIWTAEKIDFTVDGQLIYTYNPSTKDANTWPFDADQYMLINTAITADIAGNFTESPMLIDYVRIYDNKEPTNISETKKDFGFELFPNPTSNRLSIVYNGAQNTYLVKITDITGKEVYSNTVNNVNQNIDISDLENGQYHINIIDGEKSFTRSFIKED